MSAMTSAFTDTSDLATVLSEPIHGKVRDIFTLEDGLLLLVATDRISAFDVILKNGIPNKGAILTNISAFWFGQLAVAMPNLKHHLVSLTLPQEFPEELRAQYERRSMRVTKYRVFPIEAIVRGYITGSAWDEYKQHGTVHGIKMPENLIEGQAFPGGALYTPSTKAEQGKHDENLHPDQVFELLGEEYATRIMDLSLNIYIYAHNYAYKRGLIIADTKFEFGLNTETNEVVLIDEILTPDSSRFWPVSSYKPGGSQVSFDKQCVRDWLISEGLKGQSDVELPEDVVKATEEKYKEAYQLIVGRAWDS